MGTLRYTINNYEQEKELARLQTENELRDANRRAEEDFKSKQAAESERAKAARQAEDSRLSWSPSEPRRRARNASSRTNGERPRKNHACFRSSLRILARPRTKLLGLQSVRQAICGRSLLSPNETTRSMSRKHERARRYWRRRNHYWLRETRLWAGLRADILRLKAQTGDVDTIAIIRRELFRPGNPYPGTRGYEPRAARRAEASAASSQGGRGG